MNSQQMYLKILLLWRNITIKFCYNSKKGYKMSGENIIVILGIIFILTMGYATLKVAK